MGSPMTFMILPKVSGPTGILMGAPVSRTFWPRTRPSVPSMAIVLTVFSPQERHHWNFIAVIQTNWPIEKCFNPQYHFGTLTQMLSHLEHQSALTASHLQCIENRRQAFIELDIHHSTNHSHYAAVGLYCLSSWGSITPAWKDNVRKRAVTLTATYYKMTSHMAAPIRFEKS